MTFLGFYRRLTNMHLRLNKRLKVKLLLPILPYYKSYSAAESGSVNYSFILIYLLQKTISRDYWNGVFTSQMSLLPPNHQCQSTDKTTNPFNGLFSGTTQVSRYQKGKPNLDFTEARDGEWQWNQLGHMQVCTALQTDSQASTLPLLCFYRPDALPAAQPTASKHWRQSTEQNV